MRILIRFVDNELLEADSDAVDAWRPVFVVRPLSGNNILAWISMASVKYITVPEHAVEYNTQSDPRALRGAPKIVLRFADGEVLRAYKDDVFTQDGDAFSVRLWDATTGRLVRAIVSTHALKALFYVHQWDSRVPEAPPRRSRAKALAR